jgi:hypothetical protein
MYRKYFKNYIISGIFLELREFHESFEWTLSLSYLLTLLHVYCINIFYSAMIGIPEL